METGALFSDCKKFRYSLWRIWDSNKPLVLFIMLNPSTADEVNNDPTISRTIDFAKSWDFGGIFIGNLFAYRTPSPKELLKVSKTSDIIGPDNDKFLLDMSKKCNQVVFAWGNDGKILCRDKQVSKLFPKALCIDKSKLGQPKHPLYLKKDLSPRVF